MSAYISTTSETLVVSIETDRGKLHNIYYTKISECNKASDKDLL